MSSAFDRTRPPPFTSRRSSPKPATFPPIIHILLRKARQAENTARVQRDIVADRIRQLLSDVRALENQISTFSARLHDRSIALLIAHQDRDEPTVRDLATDGSEEAWDELMQRYQGTMNTAALLQAAPSPGNPSSPPQPHTSTMSSMQAPQAPASSPTLIRMQTILKPSVIIVTFILPVIIVFMAWLKTVSIHFDVPSPAMSYTGDLVTIAIHRRCHRGTYKETNPEACGIG